MIKTHFHSLLVSESIGAVSVIDLIPDAMKGILVLAHGAGAGMSHKFMEDLAHGLAAEGVSTVRFNFPFIENKKRRPDSKDTVIKTITQVVDYVKETYPDTKLFVGGKSFGGRMMSHYVVDSANAAGISGLVYYGFPLHPAGKGSIDRANHLSQIDIPMLFLQGTHDKLARLDLLQGVLEKLPTATLQTFDNVDHSFTRRRVFIISDLVHASLSWLNARFEKA